MKNLVADVTNAMLLMLSLWLKIELKRELEKYPWCGSNAQPAD
jgi:hypothetical protein